MTTLYNNELAQKQNSCAYAADVREATGDIDVGNGRFGELFTCIHYKHVSKVVFGW